MDLLATLRHLFHPQRSNNHRPRIIHPEGFLVLALLAISTFALTVGLPRVSSKAGQVLGFASNITASDVVTQTNFERTKLNLPPLKMNSTLNEGALAKGQDMLSKQYWAHVAPDGTQPWEFFKRAKYNYSVAGENLARDFSNTPDMMTAWMNSPTHRENIVNPLYKEIGIAVINGKLHGIETTLVVQFFGSPVNAQAAITPEAVADDLHAGQVLSFAEALPTKVQEMGKSAQVLASSSIKIGELEQPPLFSPLQLLKAFFLAVLFIVIVTLIYDMIIMRNRQSVRLVGKNLAHLIFFGLIAFLVIYFKSGVIS